MNRNAFIQIIETLNEADNITLLGLPANVDSMQQQVQSANVISQLKAMVISLKESPVTNLTYDQHQNSLPELSSMQTHRWATELTPYLKLWKSVRFKMSLL